MRRSQIVALCLAVGALIAAAITPGVIGSSRQQLPARTHPAVPPGFTVERQVTDNSGPMPSVFTVSSKGGEIKPGEPGWVPPPKPGQPGYEPTGKRR